MARWHGNATVEACYYEGSTIAAHRSPSIDPGSDQWRGGTIDAKAETCYTTKPPPLQPQATLNRPRVRSVASGIVDAKAEACQQEVALGKQWWRLAM